MSSAVMKILLTITTLCTSAFSKDLETFLFQEKLKTDAIIVYKDSKVLLEKYDRGYDKDTKHIMWSVSKSFTSALAGIAVKDKALDINQSICDFYPQFNLAKKCDITVKHLLTYTAGFKWAEVYEPLKFKDVSKMKDGDVFQMNYGVGNKDVAGYVLSRKLKFKPGTTVQYNTGTPNVVMGILKKIYGENYKSFIKERLFEKIDAQNYFWVQDKSGTYLGGSHLYTTPRVMLNFGKLYLNRGAVNGEQIIDQSWVDFSRTQNSATEVIEHQDLPGVDVVESLGALWWVNTPLKGKTPWPDAPSDTYVAWGHWSQFIVIIPSENMVLVRTGTDKKEYFDLNKFIKLSIEYAKKAKKEERK